MSGFILVLAQLASVEGFFQIQAEFHLTAQNE